MLANLKVLSRTWRKLLYEGSLQVLALHNLFVAVWQLFLDLCNWIKLKQTESYLCRNLVSMTLYLCAEWFPRLGCSAAVSEPDGGHFYPSIYRSWIGLTGISWYWRACSSTLIILPMRAFSQTGFWIRRMAAGESEGRDQLKILQKRCPQGKALV